MSLQVCRDRLRALPTAQCSGALSPPFWDYFFLTIPSHQPSEVSRPGPTAPTGSPLLPQYLPLTAVTALNREFLLACSSRRRSLDKAPQKHGEGSAYLQGPRAWIPGRVGINIGQSSRTSLLMPHKSHSLSQREQCASWCSLAPSVPPVTPLVPAIRVIKNSQVRVPGLWGCKRSQS